MKISLIGTVERQVELEIGELLFDGMELVHIGSLLQRTGTVPERHGALGLFGLEQMHQVAAWIPARFFQDEIFSS